MGFKSSLGKAIGRGSAKEGSHHWLAQRISAVALIILVLWIISVVFKFSGTDMSGMTSEDMHKFALDWYSSLFNSLMSIFFVIAIFFHGALGIQVVIEDYVHNERAKVLSIIIMKLLCTASAIAGVFSIFSIYLKGN